MRNTLRNTLLGLIFLLILASIFPMAWSATGLASTEPIAITPAGITYEARAGDTLLSIAQQWTTRSENWVALAKINHISQDSSIPIGTPILIPSDLLNDEPSLAQVVALSGKVTASTADGQAIVMRVGMKLAEGVQIETGINGFLTMSLPDASRISLPSNSRVIFSRLRMARYTKSPRTELMLLRGHIESRVSPLEDNKGSYEVRTPMSVAGVRGTQFRVGLEGDSVTNEVLSGKVAVGKAKQPAALTLGAGKGNVINAKTVGPEIDLLPAPQLDRLTNNPTPQIQLTPVAGAVAYHVQIANDPDAQDVLAEGRSTDARVKFFGLPDGAYFARVSAIDQHGLEGFTRIQAISFATRAPTTASTLTAAQLSGAPFVDGSDDKQVTLRWRAEVGHEFIVQVARDAQFTWLIFNSNTSTAETRLPRPAFGTYYARVQSVNADGSVNPFSASQPFIVTDHWVINDGGPANNKKNSSSGGHSS
jgi:hypothetical protein